MEKRRITIKVKNVEINIITDDTSEYIHKVANYVEQIMKEVENSKEGLPSSHIPVLTSIIIADELHKVRAERDELKKKLESPNYVLGNISNELEEVIQESAKRTKIYEETIDKILKAIDEGEASLSEQSILSKRVIKLEESLRQKRSDLKRKNRKNQISFDDTL